MKRRVTIADVPDVLCVCGHARDEHQLQVENDVEAESLHAVFAGCDHEYCACPGFINHNTREWLLAPSIGPVLAKAAVDPFDYCCMIEGVVGIVYFTELEIFGDFVLLFEVRMGHDFQGSTESNLDIPPCPRGLCVHKSRIVWSADAPHGS